MDPSMFLQYSPPTGLPQESKLVTYMNRSTSTPTRSLNQVLGNLSLESSPTVQKDEAELMYATHQQMGNGAPPGSLQLVGEFVPISYLGPNMIMPHSPLHSPPPSPIPYNTMVNPQVHQLCGSAPLMENVGGTTYFYSTNDSMNNTACLSSTTPHVPVVAPAASPYASQIYSGTPTHMGAMGGGANKPGLAATFYTPETIRAEIYQRNEVLLVNNIRSYPDLPENVEMYTDLTPLEVYNPHALASSFRASHRMGGDHYALRRLHGYSGAAGKRLDAWKQIDHPNIVRLHDCFCTKAFGDHSMVMVYDYHPGCTSLMHKYLATGTQGTAAESNGPSFHDPFSNDPDAPRPYTHQKNAMLRAVACGALLPEAVLWSLLVQLTAALRAIHSSGLACRGLDPSKVVMNGCRVRIAWCGVADMHTSGNDLNQAQQEDLTALGRLALALACRTMHCDNLPASMDLVSRSYSPDLKNLILYLLSSAPSHRTVTDLMPMIGARFYTQVEALQRRADAFEDQLAHEIDNGRLLRILIKLGVVNERPELNLDSSWSETGDRYMLKLFRDYLFHSVTEDGRPWIDQAHLAHCLNQLDGGTGAKVELMSRDEQSVLVVSYAELKHCLEQAFEEVMAAGAPT